MRLSSPIKLARSTRRSSGVLRVVAGVFDHGSCLKDFDEGNFGQRLPEIAVRTVVMPLGAAEDRLPMLSHALESAPSQTLLHQIPKPASTKFSQELPVGEIGGVCRGVRSSAIAPDGASCSVGVDTVLQFVEIGARRHRLGFHVCPTKLIKWIVKSLHRDFRSDLISYD